MLRHQLPVYSPLSLGAILRAVGSAGEETTKRLRERLCERFHASRAVLCGSGTQALTLALRSSSPHGRPIVALPAYACYDLVSAAVGADARIVFFDLVPETLAPDLDSLRRACEEGPDAVVIAPLYGLPVDWDAVEEVVRSCGALLVEDAAQGIGASDRGRPLGSLGDVSVLSFGRGKGWTGGGGGALLERRPRTEAERPTSATGRSLSLVAKVAGQWAMGRPALYGIPAALPWMALGETIYHPPTEPASIHPLAAALALENEAAAVREAEARRENTRDLLKGVSDLSRRDLLVPVPPAVGKPGYLRLPLMATNGVDGFPRRAGARSLGIMPGYPRALPSLPEAIDRVRRTTPLSGAEEITRRLVTLPTHSRVTPGDRARVVAALAEYRADR